MTSEDITPRLVVERESFDEYCLRMAYLVSTRTTCARRAVGCVLVDANKHIIATGYNGVPSSFPHCNEGNLCEGALLPSGQAGTLCKSTHAEQNALLQCRDSRAIMTAYITCNPCDVCIKLLLNTSCTRIVFAEEYPSRAKEDWIAVGREWIHMPMSGITRSIYGR